MISDPLETAARKIVQRLQDAGFRALYAGGCVRDSLRGVQPHDYDIATDAKPEDVQRLFPRTVAVGAQFGVICVMDGDLQFEVASFRADGIYIDGRRPESVAFSSPEEDAQRRDFTINGLFFDPIANELIDYVGGRADLDARLLRAIGNPADRFREDRLRMLRAVRFAAMLDLQIDPATWAAVCENSAHISEVSAERIRDEIVKIFTSDQRVRGLDLLDQSGLLRAILPEMETLKGCEQPPQWHPEGDVWTHTRIMLGMIHDKPSVPLTFGILLHDIGKPPTQTYDEIDKRIRFSGHDKLGAEMTEQILLRLRFSRREIDETVEIVARHMHFKDVPDMRVSKLKRFMAGPVFNDELELHRVDCGSSNGDLSNYDFVLRKREEFSHEPLIPEPLITGKDLIVLGHKPGPNFKAILEAVQSRQLEGTLTDRENALAWVREEFPAE